MARKRNPANAHQGHGKQDLAPVPNPRHTTHYSRWKDRHSSRSRHPRRSLPNPCYPRLNRPKQPPSTVKHAERRNHRRPIQLHLQVCDPAPAEQTAPRRTLFLSSQDWRSRLCRRISCCRSCIAWEPCSCRGQGYDWKYGYHKRFFRRA